MTSFPSVRLPKEFVEQLSSLLGDEEWQRFQEAVSQSPPVSVRLNPCKPMSVASFEVAGQVPWCPMGYYLENRPSFTYDPLFHAGGYYVQEASSMFLWPVVKMAYQVQTSQTEGEPIRVLDLCAAPGGKSTLLSDALPNDALLVLNEPIRQRACVLAENVQKWGISRALVTQTLAASFPPNTFDIVLCDAPCSGEGMFRKEASDLSYWSLNNVKLCAQRQREILSEIWPALKPGGCLIYSTCTFNLDENERQLQWLISELGAQAIEVDLKDYGAGTAESMGISPAYLQQTGYRFFFHKTRGEGLFMALLRKPDDTIDNASPRKTPKGGKVLTSLPSRQHAALLSQLHCPKAYELVELDGRQCALERPLIPLYERLVSRRIKMLSAGIVLGQLKSDTLVPDAALALSPCLRLEQQLCHELSYEQALSYLRRESLILPMHLPKGWVLLTYKQLALGWAKQLGQRANNLYPSEWRIRN